MKTPFNRGLWDVVREQMCDAPEGQISERVRAKLMAFMEVDSKASAKEVFDFMDSISKEPLTEISGFVKVLFDVRRFYEEPHDPLGDLPRESRVSIAELTGGRYHTVEQLPAVMLGMPKNEEPDK